MERLVKSKSLRRRGIAAVEAALVMPLLLLLVLGLIEYGWMFFAFHVTGSAAREGCRIAVTRDATEAQMAAAIDSRMATGGFGGYTVNFSPGMFEEFSAGEDQFVDITLPYASITNFALLPVPDSLTSRVVMRKEGPLFPQ